jgi:hypothetical protein
MGFPPFAIVSLYEDPAMGLKILTSVKLLLYDCQNIFGDRCVSPAGSRAVMGIRGVRSWFCKAQE